MFDRKKFLMKNLNDGTAYWSNDCGCIKGNIANICGLQPNLEAWMLQVYLAANFPRMATAADIAENILLAGYPQKAKLFFLDMVEKYDVAQGFKVPDSVELSRSAEHWREFSVPREHNQFLKSIKFTPAVTKVKTRLWSEMIKDYKEEVEV